MRKKEIFWKEYLILVENFGIQYFSFIRLIREFSVSFIYISIIVVGLFLFLSALSSFLVLNGFIRKFYLNSIDRCLETKLELSEFLRFSFIRIAHSH